MNAKIVLGNGVVVAQENWRIQFYFHSRNIGSCAWNDPMAGKIIISQGSMVPVMNNGQLTLETPQTANAQEESK